MLLGRSCYEPEKFHPAFTGNIQQHTLKVEAGKRKYGPLSMFDRLGIFRGTPRATAQDGKWLDYFEGKARSQKWYTRSTITCYFPHLK